MVIYTINKVHAEEYDMVTEEVMDEYDAVLLSEYLHSIDVEPE